ncbi:ATP-utilizing chromatin assembly and remodelling N-terminal-domain-containing protein [Aspergillus granulosus]|uniref:ATP-utilizing chromatin assembly and remodelling N-terminal-domain-containing protein n=1 Tax=Aspergillus granulosus TaxID=176169 RepID=A0ABR4HUR3_9EURO
MVLFKRKPVQYLPRPVIEDDSSEVWVVPETNEVFTNYESYLQRMDFYKQRKFICEITGHSGLTFFEAHRSEMEESREVNNTFPDALKGPILRRTQFSTVSRVDNLVDEIYEEFKQDFYPGEPVLILLDDNTRLHGVIRDKANFAEQLYPDGTVKQAAYATYLVKVLDRPNEEALLDQHHITRDRKTFTKQMLRAFIKNNVTRESWNGAPWLVKPSIAEEFRISTEVPKHLQYGARVAEKKAQKKADQEGFFGFFASQQLPELKPAVKGPKTKPSPQDLARSEEAQFQEYKRSLNGNPSFLVGNKSTNGLPRPLKPQEAEKIFPPPPAVVIKAEPPKPPTPPPIKYPIEDLDIPPNREKKKQRPPLKFLKANETDDANDEDLLQDDIAKESVGLFLETWNTLNVYCEVFQLDSFTFDDFFQAMRFSSDEVDCELFVEVHCAVLKNLVNEEKDNNGAIQISLPQLPTEDSDESDDDENEEEDEEDEAEPTPEPVVTRMTTRGSLAKAEAENLKAQINGAEPEEVKIHRAAEMLSEYGWIDRLRKRDFRNGGWEMIMIGLLHQLSARPSMEKICNQILEHLAPLDQEPSQGTAQKQYSTLDVNLRIRALQIICMLSLETKAIRNYLEECSNQMTEFRKEKIEYQKARKAALEELRRLHQERKSLQPELEKSPTPIPELEATEDTKMGGVDGDSQVADSDGDGTPQRALRGGVDRALERKRKLDEERERKEQLAKQPKGSKQYQRVLKKIEEQKAAVKKFEDKIEVVDNDLREADCPRTRCLGKDRFCNRYWWFERNAMPYEGMPNSSTAEAKYANGRLWVQGPDDMERLGFIDVPDDIKKQYQKQFHVSPAERKKHEEGPTRLSRAYEWGYYDEPESLEKLLDWLDARGERETKLRKELLLQRDNIIKSMQTRQQYLGRAEDDSEEMPTKRVTTRNKTYVADNKHRCLTWRNSTALAENGHLHVDASRPAKRKRGAVEEPKEIKVTNRQGKPLTRQGARYNF